MAMGGEATIQCLLFARNPLNNDVHHSLHNKQLTTVIVYMKLSMGARSRVPWLRPAQCPVCRLAQHSVQSHSQ